MWWIIAGIVIFIVGVTMGLCKVASDDRWDDE